MADTVTCPNLDNYLNEENCLENIGGTSAVAYYFVKSDLSAPLVLSGNTYSVPQFKAGKGLYKFDLLTVAITSPTTPSSRPSIRRLLNFLVR